MEKTDADQLKYHHYYKGEALALRALLHFDLVRLFGPNYADEPDKVCMPYVKVFKFETPKHTTVKNVYENVIADLLLAESLMQGDPILTRDYDEEAENVFPFLKNRKDKLNLLGVKSLLARVYYSMRDLDKANQYAQEVITNTGPEIRFVNPEEVAERHEALIKDEETGDIIGSYGDSAYILENPDRLFQSEVIAGFKFPDENNWQWASYHFNKRPGDQYALQPDRDVNKWYDATDIRLAAYFTWIPNRNIYQFHRYEKGTGDFPFISAIIRLPELYFISIEHLMYQDLPGAVKMYNEFRATRWAEPVDETEIGSADLLFTHLKKEWRREFFGDGQLFYFYKLHDLDIEINANKWLVVPDYAWVLPLPEDEIKYGDN